MITQSEKKTYRKLDTKKVAQEYNTYHKKSNWDEVVKVETGSEEDSYYANSPEWEIGTEASKKTYRNI